MRGDPIYWILYDLWKGYLPFRIDLQMGKGSDQPPRPIHRKGTFLEVSNVQLSGPSELLARFGSSSSFDCSGLLEQGNQRTHDHCQESRYSEARGHSKACPCSQQSIAANHD